MPPELVDFSSQLRAWIAQVVREEVSKVRAEITAHAAPLYMTPGQAAAHACVHVSTIRRWIDEGRLEKYGAGKGVRVRTDELEKIMRPGRRQPKRTKKAPRLSPEQQAARALGLEDVELQG